jgi:hypothetical protein
MSLYDSYKPTNSVQVKEFAGSIVADLAEAKKQLNTQYLAGLEYEKEAKNTLSESANLINPEDAGRWNQINQDAEAQIQKITEGGRYENAVPALYQLSNQTAQRLKPLIGQKKLAEEFKTKLSDKALNLTGTMQEMYLDVAKDENKGTQLDASGRVLNPWQVSKQPVKNMDNVEIVQKMLQGIGMNGDSRSESIDKLGEDYKITNSSGVEVLTKEQLENRLRAGMSIDPNLKQSVRQQAEARAFENAPGLTDASAVSFLEENTPTTAAAKELMSEDPNLTPKRALLKAMANEQEEILTSNLIEYAKTGAHQKTSSSRTMELSTQTLWNRQDALAASKKSETDTKEAYTIVGTVLSGGVDTWAKTGGELFNKKETLNKSLSALNSQLKDAEKNLNNPNLDVRIEAQAEVNRLRNQVDAIETSRKSLANAEKMLITRAIAELYPGKEAEVLADERNAVWKLFNSVGKGGKINAVTEDGKGVSVPTSELFRAAVDKKSYSIVQQGLAGSAMISMIEIGKFDSKGNKVGSYTVSGLDGTNLLDALTGGKSTMYTKGLERAKTMATTGLGVQGTGIPITEAKDKEAFTSLAPFSAVYDASNSFVENTEEIDWSKSTNVTYIPELNRVGVTVQDLEGKSKQVLVDASTMNLGEKVGSSLAKNSDLILRSYGSALKNNSIPTYMESLNQTGTIVSTVPGTDTKKGANDGLPIYGMTDKGVRVRCMYKRTKDGSYSMLDMSGNTIKSGLPLSQVIAYFEMSKFVK